MGYQQVIDVGQAFGIGAMMRRPAARVERRVDRVEPRPGATEAVPNAPAPGLARLVERMAAHDERALAGFYDATVAKAYGVALRIVRHHPLAEEVVADAYHQAWRSAARFDSRRSGPLTWLLMICRSRALDALRARDPALLHEAPETLVAEGDEPRGDDPLDLVAAIDSRHALHAALRTLAPAQRQMIGLAFFRGLSHQEIATETRVPLGTVKSQIRRALETLRAALGAEAGGRP